MSPKDRRTAALSAALTVSLASTPGCGPDLSRGGAGGGPAPSPELPALQSAPYPGCDATARPDLAGALATGDTVTLDCYTAARMRIVEDAGAGEDSVRVVRLVRGDVALKQFDGGLPDAEAPIAGWWSLGLFSFLDEPDPQLVVAKFSGGAHCCWTT